MNDAERPRPSSFPASDDPRCLEKTRQWLDELRAVDADVAQYAHGVTQRHFAAANLPMRGGGEVPTTWWSFCWSLYLDLSPLLKDGTHDGMVRALLEELVEVALLNPDGDLATRLAEMWRHFIATDPPRSRFEALLSATALAHLEAVDKILEARAEDERWRMDQSGY